MSLSSRCARAEKLCFTLLRAGHPPLSHPRPATAALPPNPRPLTTLKTAGGAAAAEAAAAAAADTTEAAAAAPEAVVAAAKEAAPAAVETAVAEGTL